MLNIPDIWLLHMQCRDRDGQTGSFFTSKKTGKQTSETYVSLCSLLNGNEHKFANSHGIKILWPGQV